MSFGHYYDDNGVYQAVIEVEDDGGQLGSYTVPVTVYNVAPSGTLVGGLDQPHLDANGVTGALTEAGTLVRFLNVNDPSQADLGTLSYYWQVGDTGWQKTDIAEFEVPEANFEAGTVTPVTAYIEDKDGGASKPQTIDLMVSKAAEGVFLPAGMAKPAGYDSYADYYTNGATVEKKDIPPGTQVQTIFTPDQVAAQWGGQLRYNYEVVVLDTEQTTLRHQQLSGGLVGPDHAFGHVVPVEQPDVDDNDAQQHRPGSGGGHSAHYPGDGRRAAGAAALTRRIPSTCTRRRPARRACSRPPTA